MYENLTRYSNATEIVQTFPTYLIAASKTFLHLGAKVIVSSQTPNNPWETGNYTYTPTRFSYYAWYFLPSHHSHNTVTNNRRLSAAELGGPSNGVYYVDHGSYAAQMMKNLGKDVVDANYPMDHTHTAPYLADLVAQSFVLGLKCGTSGLEGLVLNATARIEGPILGSCIAVNDTLPI